MRRMLTFLACVSLLASCGQGGGGAQQSAAEPQTCALAPDVSAIFGADAGVVAHANDGAIAADCSFTSADGARTGGVMLFTPASLGSVTAAAKVAELAQSWDTQTETPLEPVEIGEGGQIAKDLAGYQTQIVFSAGGSVVAVMGSSGDDAMNGEQIARALAAQALAHVPAQ